MPKYHAHVRQDRLEIIEDEKFRKYLTGKVGELITIDIERVHSQRSIQENSYYWGVVLAILSDYFGYTAEEMHEILKTTFLTERVRMKHDKRRKLTMTRSSATLSTKEFEAFLENVRVWAQLEFNVIIPLPEKKS